jgi:RHS repeat-associated protein
VFSITGPATQNLGLPGQWFQLETGLNYNWHRHYDASLARYTSPDPLGFVDGPAVYAYAGGAPHIKTDRDGLNSRGRSWDGPPNTFVCSPAGGRMYGPDGTPSFDFDKPHGTHNRFNHLHNFGPQYPGGRGPAIPLNKPFGTLGQ